MKKKFLALVLSSMLFAACGSDSSSPSSPTGGDPNNNGEQPSTPSGEPSAPGGATMLGTLHYPANANGDAVVSMYNTWLANYYASYATEVTPSEYDKINPKRRPLLEKSGRIKYSTPEQTVSEGIGYGMLMSAILGDKEHFDALMNYYLAWRVAPDFGDYFMNWKIVSYFSVKGGNSATDADIDIVAGLIIAYEKWKNQEYLDYALQNASSIYAKEVNPTTHLMTPGNGGAIGDGHVYNISYFSLAALHLLMEYDKDHDWKTVYDATIKYMTDVQDKGHGLWPDWSDAAGVPTDAGNGATTSRNGACEFWGLEGIRIPFRLVWDYLWFGDENVKKMIDKALKYTYEVTGHDATKALAKYKYQGEDNKPHGVGGAAFAGAFCVLGLIDPAYSDYVSSCNTYVLNAGIAPGDYFEPSIQLIYSLLLNGKFTR